MAGRALKLSDRNWTMDGLSSGWQIVTEKPENSCMAKMAATFIPERSRQMGSTSSLPDRSPIWAR